MFIKTYWYGSDQLRTELKTKFILQTYRRKFPKSINQQLSSPKLHFVPYHPAVNPYHADDNILEAMNERDYCYCCEITIKQMERFKHGTYAGILASEYLSTDPLPNFVVGRDCIARRLGINNRMTFNRRRKRAFRLFAEVCNTDIFTKLADVAINGSDVDISQQLGKCQASVSYRMLI